MCGYTTPTRQTSTQGIVTPPTTELGNLSYPEYRMNDGTPAGPIVTPVIASPPDPSAPVINPLIISPGGGYVLNLCNATSQPHVVRSVTVTLVAQTPFTGHLNVWQPCSGSYQPGVGLIGTGCGGADFENEYLSASFHVNAGVGATSPTTQRGTNTGALPVNDTINYGPLPVTLRPGQVLSVEVGMSPAPTAPAYDVFAFQIGVDSASPATAARSPVTLFAPVSRAWDGRSCETPTMQALLPAHSSDGYICPTL